MDATPGDPGDGLASAGGDAQLVSRGLIVGLDLAAKLDADSRDISETRTIGCPDAEGVAVDANIRQASDAGCKLTESLGPLRISRTSVMP